MTRFIDCYLRFKVNLSIDQNPQNSIQTMDSIFEYLMMIHFLLFQPMNRDSLYNCVIFFICLLFIDCHCYLRVYAYETNWILSILQWTTRSCWKGLKPFMILINEKKYIKVLIYPMGESWEPSSGWWWSEYIKYITLLTFVMIEQHDLKR